MLLHVTCYQLLLTFLLFPFFLRHLSTLTQMRKVEAGEAKINERVHRHIWRPKVRGKWPRHRSVDHLIHVHVSPSFSFALHASGFLALDVGSPLSGLFFRFDEPASVSFLLVPYPLCLNRCPPTTRGWECVRGSGHVPTHDAPQLAHTWCIRAASSAEASAFRCTRPRNFNSTITAFVAIESVSSASISAKNYLSASHIKIKPSDEFLTRSSVPQIPLLRFHFQNISFYFLLLTSLGYNILHLLI